MRSSFRDPPPHPSPTSGAPSSSGRGQNHSRPARRHDGGTDVRHHRLYGCDTIVRAPSYGRAGTMAQPYNHVSYQLPDPGGRRARASSSPLATSTRAASISLARSTTGTSARLTPPTARSRASRATSRATSSACRTASTRRRARSSSRRATASRSTPSTTRAPRRRAPALRRRHPPQRDGVHVCRLVPSRGVAARRVGRRRIRRWRAPWSLRE